MVLHVTEYPSRGKENLHPIKKNNNKFKKIKQLTFFKVYIQNPSRKQATFRETVSHCD